MTYLQRWGNKYGAKSSIYNGRTYHSKKEAGRAQELDLLIKAKDIKGWEPQYKIDIKVNGYHICNYYIDFRIFENDGTETLEEVKGFETDIWRLKWKLTEALYGDDPNIHLRIIK